MHLKVPDKPPFTLRSAGLVVGLALYTMMAVATVATVATAAHAGINKATAAFSSGKFSEALENFRTLAEGGHLDAEFMLGVMYFQGRGIKQDRPIAAIWFYKSALKGHAGAQLALGSIHIRGVGVSQDLHKAYGWLTLASRSNSAEIREKAKNLLVDVAQLMTPGEIENAKETADAFKPVKSGLTRSH
jgi:uncharacterized protein